MKNLTNYIKECVYTKEYVNEGLKITADTEIDADAGPGLRRSMELIEDAFMTITNGLDPEEFDKKLKSDNKYSKDANSDAIINAIKKLICNKDGSTYVTGFEVHAMEEDKKYFKKYCSSKLNGHDIEYDLDDYIFVTDDDTIVIPGYFKINIDKHMTELQILGNMKDQADNEWFLSIVFTIILDDY